MVSEFDDQLGRVEQGAWCVVTGSRLTDASGALAATLHEYRRRTNLSDRSPTVETTNGAFRTSFSATWPGSFRITIATFAVADSIRVAHIYAIHSKSREAEAFVAEERFREDAWQATDSVP